MLVDGVDAERVIQVEGGSGHVEGGLERGVGRVFGAVPPREFGSSVRNVACRMAQFSRGAKHAKGACSVQHEVNVAR